jgi:predicted alpha/beta-hydrolase family hydrolase
VTPRAARRRPSPGAVGAGGALLLAPGAGADRNQPALLAVDAAVTALGVAVERMDFPYRTAGRRSPDGQAALLRAVREEAAGLAARSRVPAGAVWLGGRSMGGRMCSIAVAEGLPSAGLVLISYPLHPPGRPERLRTEHFPGLQVPCLFVSGTRDAFGTPAELEQAALAIPGPVAHVWLEGRDHGLRGGDGQVAGAVAAWINEQLRSKGSPAPAIVDPPG